MGAGRGAALAGGRLAAVLALLAVLASIGVPSGGPSVAPAPTASTACRPLGAAVAFVTHTGPPPPQVAWNALAAGDLNGALSLPEAATISELVLVGRWMGMERFGSIGDPGEGLIGHYAVAVIGVDRLVRGTLPPGCVDLVRVPFLISFGAPGSDLPEVDYAAVARRRPVEPALLFLQSWAGVWDRAGGELPDWVTPLDRYDLFRTIGIDGALPLVGDRVSEVVFENDMARWRLELAGRPLDEVIKALTAVEPGPGAVP